MVRTCLVVDDSRVVRKIARRILEAHGYAVSEADDGQQALDACRAQMPDCVLLDWNMPVMNGLDVLKRLRGILREAIIVFWEAPKLTKYSPNRTYSVAARKFIKAGRADKRRHLRFDHAIPLRMVVDELLDAHHNPRKIKSILQRVEARLLRGANIRPRDNLH